MQAWTDGCLLRLLLTATLPVLFADGNLAGLRRHFTAGPPLIIHKDDLKKMAPMWLKYATEGGSP